MRERKNQSGADEPLPRLRAPVSALRLVAVLDEAAKRGKLPEFEPVGAATGQGPGSAAGGGSAAPLFKMLAYGAPWDADLIGEIEPASDAGGEAGSRGGDSSTVVQFRLRLRRRTPLIFGAVLVLTVEPGRYFTDELLATFIPALHGHIPTWWWWYPLTIIPIPWLWRGWLRKSRKTTAENARERIGQMGEIVGGEVMERAPADAS